MADNKVQNTPVVSFDNVQEQTVPMFDHVENVVLQVPKSEVEQALRSERYTLPAGIEVPIVDPSTGESGYVKSEDAYNLVKQGLKLEDPQDTRSRVQEERYGNQDLAAMAAGAARGLTFGVSDQALTRTGLVAPETLAGIEESNPVASTIGEVGGIGAGLLTTGPAGLGVKAAATAGKGAERFLAKQALKAGVQNKIAQSIASKIAPAFVGSAVEGAFYGTGELLSENALGRADVNAENLLASMGTGALVGGAFGAGLKALEPVVDVAGKGISYATKPIANYIDDLTNKQKAFAELTGMTKKEAQRAKASGILDDSERILKEEYGAGKLMSDDELLESVSKRKVESGQSIERINKELESAEGLLLSESGPNIANKLEQAVTEEVLKPLQGTGAGKEALEQVQKLVDEFRTIYDQKDVVDAGQLVREMRALDSKLKKFYKDPTTASESIKAAYEIRSVFRGEINALADRLSASTQSALGQELRAANRSYQIASSLEQPLERKVLAKSGINFKDLGYAAVGSGSGITGAIAAGMAKFVDSDLRRRLVALGTLEKANLNALKEVQSVARSFVSKAARVSEKVVPYKLTESALSGNLETGKKARSTQEAYANIQNNLHRFASNPQEIIDRVSRNTEDMRDVAPETSAALVAATDRGLNFLYSKLPRKPQAKGALDFLNKERPPSSMDLAKFERYLKALESPKAAMSEIKKGIINQETVDVMKAVYPNMFETLRNEIISQIADKPGSIGYNDKVRLSVLLEVPTDISLQPENIAALQNLYTPSEQAGVQGPQPQPGAKNIESASRMQTGTEEVLERG